MRPRTTSVCAATGRGSPIRQRRAGSRVRPELRCAKGDATGGSAGQRHHYPRSRRPEPHLQALDPLEGGPATTGRMTRCGCSLALTPILLYVAGSTTGLAVSLEECVGCGVSGGDGRTMASASRAAKACCSSSPPVRSRSSSDTRRRRFDRSGRALGREIPDVAAWASEERSDDPAGDAGAVAGSESAALLRIIGLSTRRVLSPVRPTECSPTCACHGGRLRARRGAPPGATRERAQ